MNYTNMWKYEKQFRRDNPQTIGEKDKSFDLDNYKDWLEEKIELYLETLDYILACQGNEYILPNHINDEIKIILKKVE